MAARGVRIIRRRPRGAALARDYALTVLNFFERNPSDGIQQARIVCGKFRDDVRRYFGSEKGAEALASRFELFEILCTGGGNGGNGAFDPAKHIPTLCAAIEDFFKLANEALERAPEVSAARIRDDEAARDDAHGGGGGGGDSGRWE